MHSPFLLFKLKDTEDATVGYSVYMKFYKICLLISTDHVTQPQACKRSCERSFQYSGT